MKESKFHLNLEFLSQSIKSKWKWDFEQMNRNKEMLWCVMNQLGMISSFQCDDDFFIRNNATEFLIAINVLVLLFVRFLVYFTNYFAVFLSFLVMFFFFFCIQITQSIYLITVKVAKGKINERETNKQTNQL